MERKSGFRTPKSKKLSKANSTVAQFSETAVTPMLGRKSELWRGSVGKYTYYDMNISVFKIFILEVISDVELTQSDTELARMNNKREKRKRTMHKNCLSGFAMKSGKIIKGNIINS